MTELVITDEGLLRAYNRKFPCDRAFCYPVSIEVCDDLSVIEFSDYNLFTWDEHLSDTEYEWVVLEAFKRGLI